MKISIIFLVVATFASTFAYDDTDNKVDYAKMSPQELNQALDCYLDRGPCDESENHYKIHIRDSMIDDCAKCSDFHRHNGRVFFRTLEKINPKGLEEFRLKYAPEPGKLKEMEETLDRFN